MTEINPLDVLAIKNVVSRYCQALDLKDFDMLSQVFDPDVDANYPFNPNLKSLNEVKDAIKNRYFMQLLTSSKPESNHAQSRTHPHASQPHNTNHHVQI